MEKGKMQVIIGGNFIFEEGKIKFGGLYKSTYSADTFLNTFTLAFSENLPYNSYYKMQKYGYTAKNAGVSH